MSQTDELRDVAQRVADALPAAVEEVVLTGSVSRGVADELSDIEMLFVTAERLELADCFAIAADVGLVERDTWGVQGTETSRVFGYFDGVPVETVWWSRAFAEASVDALFSGEQWTSAEALANGVSLRSAGLLDAWQQRLAVYPDELAVARIEEAALVWGGFHPAGYLTLTRPGDRFALIEYVHADATRVLRILYALNRMWQPTSKRLADRVAELPVKPARLAERIEEALTETDPVRALLVMTELEIETVDLAPPGPNVDRARGWLREVAAALRG